MRRAVRHDHRLRLHSSGVFGSFRQWARFLCSDILQGRETGPLEHPGHHGCRHLRPSSWATSVTSHRLRLPSRRPLWCSDSLKAFWYWRIDLATVHVVDPSHTSRPLEHPGHHGLAEVSILQPRVQDSFATRVTTIRPSMPGQPPRTPSGT